MIRFDVAILDVVERGGAEGAGWEARVFAAPHDPDVRCVIGPRRGRDARALEQAFSHRQLLKIVGGEQYDIDEALAYDCANLAPVILERLVASLGTVESVRARIAARSRCRDAEAHVRILCVSQNEFLAAMGVRVDRRQFVVQGLVHVKSQSCR